MRWATQVIIEALKRRVGYPAGTVTLGDFAAIVARMIAPVPLTDGPYVEAYRSALAQYLGAKHVFTYGKGRMGMYALLKAMGFREDDEIIMPGYNCVVIPNAIRFAGLHPVYVDIREDDFNIDPDQAEGALTARTKAIVVQHTFGIPGDMDALLDLSRRKGLPLIEDCAHALGATWDGQQLGTIGQAGFYSTEGNKMLSTERGGILVVADADLAGRLQEQYRSTPYRSKEYERLSAWRFALRCLMGHPWCNIPTTFARVLDEAVRLRLLKRILQFDRDEYAAALEGRRVEPYPCRLGNLMSLAGLRQLRRIERDLAHRRRLVRELEDILPGKGARLARYNRQRAQPSWVRFPFVVDDRREWSARVAWCGLAPGEWLNDPIHPVSSNCEFVRYRRGSCPIAEHIAKTIMNVPVHSRVSPARIRRLRRLPDKVCT